MSPLIKPLANLEGRLYVYSQTVIDVTACTFCIGLRQRIVEHRAVSAVDAGAGRAVSNLGDTDRVSD